MLKSGCRRAMALTMGYVIEWSPPSETGERPRASSDAIELSTAESMSAPGALVTSPASKKAPARSVPFSAQALEWSEARAARMSGGASAAPRRNEEFSSKRKPTRASRGASAASVCSVMSR
jgi:hypothetical protein